MFRNCFRQRFIGLVALIVLENQFQRVTSNRSHGVLKVRVPDNPRPINERPAEPGTKQSLPDRSFVGSEGKIRKSKLEREDEIFGVARSDPDPGNRTETLAYSPGMFVSPPERITRAVPSRKRRQMVEYYVDDPDGIIETIRSNGRQYHVALNAKHNVDERRKDRDISNSEGTHSKPKTTRPPFENDDNEDVFFSGVKPGQNRDSLNLFLEGSEASGQKKRHHDVISSINDVPGTEIKERLSVAYKESGVPGQKDAEQAHYPLRGKNLSNFGNSSIQKRALLRRIVRSILSNETVASYLEDASRLSDRRKRQILEYFIDSITGKIDKRGASNARQVSTKDKRDTSNARQVSTKDRAAKRRISASNDQVEALARDASENDKKKRRGVNRGDSAEEAGRSADNDSDDLENVLQNRALSEETAEDLNDDEQRRVSDDVSFNVRRHNYVTGDDAAEESDVRIFDKRRLAYEDASPAGVHEEDFYYVEDEEEEEGSLVKREAEQADRKLDRVTREFKDVREEAQKSQRAVPLSQEERAALSKELVEIIIQEINNRLQGKPGNPELQVKRPSNVTIQQGVNLTAISTMPKQLNSTSVGDRAIGLQIAGKLRDKRRISHRSRARGGVNRRSHFNRREGEKESIAQYLEQSMKPSLSETEQEKAEDTDMVRQIVTIVIERAVSKLRNPGSNNKSGKYSAMGQPDQGLNSFDMNTVLVPPPQASSPVYLEEMGPPPTPNTFWDVEITKGENGDKNSSVDAGSEIFQDGFFYQMHTFPSIETHEYSTHNESQPKRRRRRHGLTENGRSVRASDDFSSSAAKTRAGQQVIAGVESAIFCRVIRRLVDKGRLSQEAYEKLVSKKTCFDYPGPSRNRIRRSFLQHLTVRPCYTDGHFGCSEMSLPPIDLLTGSVSDGRCEELIYVATYPSVFNFNQGRRMMTRIPIWLTHDMGGYAWGGRGSGVKPPAAPQKRNSAWGVVFAFSTPFRLWGLRFIETPVTLFSVVSIAVYLQKSDDLQNRWIPVTEAGSAEPKIIPAKSALINFTDIHNVTGVLIFLQEWKGKPMLPHPVFIACSAESSLESTDPYRLPIGLTSSWDLILKGIARESAASSALLKRDP